MSGPFTDLPEPWSIEEIMGVGYCDEDDDEYDED